MLLFCSAALNYDTPLLQKINEEAQTSKNVF
jgi:hypothetical protein